MGAELEIKSRKKIILVGDKVLIAADADSERSNHGLYLPPGVKEKEKVNSGVIVQVGPGYAVPNPHYIDQEQWSTSPKDPIKYLPLQAEEGDYATRRLLEEILAEEENHINTFGKLLVGMTAPSTQPGTS